MQVLGSGRLNSIPALSIPSTVNLNKWLRLAELRTFICKVDNHTYPIVQVLTLAFIHQLFNEHLLCSRCYAFPKDTGVQEIHRTYILRTVKQWMHTMDTKALCPHCKVLYVCMAAVTVSLLPLVITGAPPCEASGVQKKLSPQIIQISSGIQN